MRAFVTRHSTALSVLALAAAAVVSYLPSLSGAFVWDDVWVVADNDFIKSPANLAKVFSREYLTPPRDLAVLRARPIGSGEITYRPVVTLSYFLDHCLWSSRSAGYRLSNVLLHAGNAALLLYLLLIIGVSRSAALTGGLLFAVHPAAAEAVAVVSHREDLLAAFFFILALIAYLKSARVPGPARVGWQAASLAGFVLALFSKEMAITLPLVCVAYDYVCRRTIATRRYWGFAVAAGAYLFVWGVLMHNPSQFASPLDGPMIQRLPAMAAVIGKYLVWIAAPWTIHPAINDEYYNLLKYQPWAAVCSASVMAALAGVALLRRQPVVSFGIAWFLLTLAPVANLFHLNNIIAGRYLYLPLAGMCIAAAAFTAGDAARQGGSARRIARLALWAAATGFVVITWAKAMTWHDNLTLWETIVERYPRSAYARAGLAAQLQKSGQYERSSEEYRAAAELGPVSADHYNGIGLNYYMQDRYDDAIACYHKAAALDPSSAGIRSNLGLAYAAQGRDDEAAAAFKAALALDPNFGPARAGLAGR